MQRTTRTQALLAGLAGASLIAFWAVTASAGDHDTASALPTIFKHQVPVEPPASSTLRLS